jgi:maltose alpha-D-glucosyltransferase / alpha-amylase
MSQQQLDPEFFTRLRTAVAAQLPAYLPNQRWFRSKARRIQSVRLSDAIPIPLPRALSVIALVSVEFSEGPDETYVLPLVPAPHGRACASESAVIRILVSNGASEQPLIDALGDREFLVAIFEAMVGSRSFAGADGVFLAASEPALDASRFSNPVLLEPRLLKGEQSNSSVIYGDRFILKVFRRVEEGIHPDLEIGRFLTSVAHFANVPPLCGSLTYDVHQSKVMTVGILQDFVPNRGDAWRYTVESLAALFASSDHPTGEPHARSVHEGSLRLEPDATKERAGLFGRQLELISLLGKRTAELHLALASSSADPAFEPERFTTEVRGEMDRAFHDLAVQNFETLRQKQPELPEPVAGLAKQILKLEDDALLMLHTISEMDISAIRTRIHGDYHLGQVLFTGSDYFIIDFEGEPARPLSERRNKRSPLQDVAGMLRSFHYAARAASALSKQRSADSERGKDSSFDSRNAPAQIESLALQWRDMASREFLRSYRSTAGDARFLPASPADFDALLKIHLLEKAIYELGYELNNRPEWLSIPLEGIRDIVANEHSHA